MHPLFEDALARWALTPEGPPVFTASGALLPVRTPHGPGMLKVAVSAEERRGNALMVWWAGEGAARVLADDAASGTVLLERAEDPDALTTLALSGHDARATRILCEVGTRLHAVRRDAPPDLVGLDVWFGALGPAARTSGGVLHDALAAARSLLKGPRDVTVLHGDLHHGNVLHFPRRGWLAIDPKGLLGERGFDFANILCNPTAALATAPGRLVDATAVVSAATGLEFARQLRWTLAYAGLSAAWTLQDGGDPALALTVARHAAEALIGREGEA